MSTVVLVRTGTANLASVAAAFHRAGCGVRISDSADDVVAAERLVLPGVGAFGAVAERIDALGLRSSLAERVSSGRPTLAICLGLQMLAAGSEESPGAEGLGVIPAQVSALPPGVRSPQLGWNRVTASAHCALLADGVAYFANSYKLDTVPEGWSGAVTDHGGDFVAAVERGAVLACQFHPELSGAWGQSLIERWLARSNHELPAAVGDASAPVASLRPGVLNVPSSTPPRPKASRRNWFRRLVDLATKPLGRFGLEVI